MLAGLRPASPRPAVFAQGAEPPGPPRCRFPLSCPALAVAGGAWSTLGRFPGTSRSGLGPVALGRCWDDFPEPHGRGWGRWRLVDVGMTSRNLTVGVGAGGAWSMLGRLPGTSRSGLGPVALGRCWDDFPEPHGRGWGRWRLVDVGMTSRNLMVGVGAGLRFTVGRHGPYGAGLAWVVQLSRPRRWWWCRPC